MFNTIIALILSLAYLELILVIREIQVTTGPSSERADEAGLRMARPLAAFFLPKAFFFAESIRATVP